MAPFNMFQMQWQPENDLGMSDPDVQHLHGEVVLQTPKSLCKIINKIDLRIENAKNDHI